MISDGCRVSYVGSHNPSLPYDEQGVVLAHDKQSAHVKWDNGKILLCDIYDIVPVKGKSAKVESDIDDSLELSGLSSYTAEMIYNDRGSEGLLEALLESGALSVHEEAVDDAVDSLIKSIATSGWIKRLDEDSRAEMAMIVARELLKSL